MAIDDLLDEHEQGERVQQWLRRNSASLIGGVAIGIALIWGWKWWQARQQTDLMQGAERYEALVDAAGSDPAKLSAGMKDLPASSMYGVLARMQLAKLQVDAGKSQDALATLRAIQAGDSGLADVVNVRIGRLLVDTGKPAEAITLLASSNTAAALEVVGDAEARQNKPEAAQAAYKRALTSLEVGSPARSIVELKLSDVGGVPPDPAHPTAGASSAAPAAAAAAPAAAPAAAAPAVAPAAPAPTPAPAN